MEGREDTVDGDTVGLNRPVKKSYSNLNEKQLAKLNFKTLAPNRATSLRNKKD